MQISWLIFSLLTPIFWSMTNIFDQMVQRNHAKDEWNLLIVTAFAKILLVPILFLIFGFFLPSPGILLLTLLHGVSVFIPIVLYFRALHLEEASRVNIFLQMDSVLVYVLSYFLLNEILTTQQIVSFLLLFVAGFLSVYRTDESYRLFSRATVPIFSCMILWSFSDVFLKYMLQFYPVPELFLPWSYLGSLPSIFLLSFFPSFRKRFSRKSFQWVRGALFPLFLATFTALLGFITYYKAVAMGSLTLTTVVSGLQPLFVALFILLFRKFYRGIPEENFRGRAIFLKIFAFLLSFIGLWLVSTGN